MKTLLRHNRKALIKKGFISSQIHSSEKVYFLLKLAIALKILDYIKKKKQVSKRGSVKIYV